MVLDFGASVSARGPSRAAALAAAEKAGAASLAAIHQPDGRQLLDMLERESGAREEEAETSPAKEETETKAKTLADAAAALAAGDADPSRAPSLARAAPAACWRRC